MNMKISGKEYTLEYTFEAVYNKECIDNTYKIMTGMYALPSHDLETDGKAALFEMFAGMADLPKMVIENFYAGLLEHHGEDGDGTVTSLRDAKRLYKQFCIENPDSELADFNGLQTEIVGQMEKDGFFKRSGLEKMLTDMFGVEDKPKKTPTDRKKKAPTKAQKAKAEEQNLSVVE